MRRLWTKMILLIGVPTLVIYVVVLGLAMIQLNQQAHENVHREMTRLADQLSARFNLAFREAAAIAVTTARFMENAPPARLEQVYAQLESNTRSNPVVYGAAMAFEPESGETSADLACPYVHRDGEDVKRLNIGRDVYDWHADEQWQWYHVPKSTGQGAWSDPYFDEGAGNVLMVTYSEPFKRDGRFAGVTTVDIMLPTLRESVADQILGDLDFLIVNRGGMYVFSQNTREIMSGTILEEARALGNAELEDLAHRLTLGAAGVTSIDGWDSPERMLVFFAPIRSTGWMFAARLSEREAFAQVNSQLRSAAGALALALALIVVCILAVSRRITRPLATLHEQVAAIAGGNLEARVEHVAGRDEIAQLSLAFNRMTADLRANLDRLSLERATREKLERDLDLAREIQRGLLPRDTPDVPGYQLAGWNKPADQTGGDYFDWLVMADGRVLITLADVVGHGIGPALMVSLCRAYTRASTLGAEVELADIIDRVNDLLRRDMPDGRFITAAFSIIDSARSEISVLSAGQAPLLYYEAETGEVHQWNADSLPLGLVPSLELNAPRTIQSRSGDVLMLVTDGFFEWRTDDHRQFGIAGLCAFLKDNNDLPPEQFIQRLYELYQRSSNSSTQEDDLTAVVIRKL